MEERLLHRMVLDAVSPIKICESHELAGRSRITRKKHSLLRAFKQRLLPSFHFLICRN
jgi:hypothetical protein